MITEANSHEVHGIEFIAGLDAQLAAFEKHLEPRLRAEKDLWRQYRIARTAIEKVLDGLYATLPRKTTWHMQKLCQFGEVVIRPKAVIPYDDVQIVPTGDLKEVINAAMASECAVCLRDARGQKKCPLRRALMSIAPPGGLRKDSLCEYHDAARESEYGKYI